MSKWLILERLATNSVCSIRIGFTEAEGFRESSKKAEIWEKFTHSFAGGREGAEQECDNGRHPDGPHPPDVSTKSHSGRDQTPDTRHPDKQTPRQPDTQTNQTSR